MGLSLAPQAMADDSELANIERLEVHGQQTENRNALGSAENLLKGQGVDFSEAGGVSALPILNGMMGIHLNVADGFDVQVKQTMLGKKREHVIEKRNSGVNVGNARAVNVERQLDGGFRSFPVASGSAWGWHGNFESERRMAIFSPSQVLRAGPDKQARPALPWRRRVRPWRQEASLDGPLDRPHGRRGHHPSPQARAGWTGV